MLKSKVNPWECLTSDMLEEDRAERRANYIKGFNDGVADQKKKDKIIKVLLEKKKNAFQVRVYFADRTEQVFDVQGVVK
jgi:hypothetical protein